MQFKIMTFNIQGGLNSGPNAWERRAGLVVETVRRQLPDLLGFQELKQSNMKELQAGLPEYRFELGPGTGTPPTNHNAIFWREAAFEPVGSGGFWLSETPGVPASIDWDLSEPRSVNWVRLRWRRGGAGLLYLNTHLDHFSPAARLHSAELIVRKIEDLRRGALPVVLAGDFNSTPYYPSEMGEPGESSDQGLYELFIRHGYADAFLAAGQRDSLGSATFQNYEGTQYLPAHNAPWLPWRIDWILLLDGARKLRALSAEIDHFHAGGRYPSDHYPVVAMIESRE